MAASTPIWGKEEATDAVMAHMLCQDSELSIFSSTFTQLPVYHLVVELLRKDPAKRLTLKALQRKSYFRSTLDTRVVSDLLRERLVIEDIDTDEENGEGAVMIPEEDDSIFINFSRIWSTNGWGRQISRGILIEALKNYLAVDTTALKALDGFMDKFLPLSSEEESSIATGDPVTIERINQAFPKIASKCQLGNWILHQVYLKSQSRIYMIRQARQKIEEYLEEKPVYHLCCNSSLRTMTSCMESALRILDSLSDIDRSIRRRVLEVMDMIGYNGPAKDEEDDLRVLIHLNEETTQLSAKCATFIIYPGKEENTAMRQKIHNWIDSWTKWRSKMLEANSGLELNEIFKGLVKVDSMDDAWNVKKFLQETKTLQEARKKYKGTEIGERYEKAFAGDVPSMLWLGEAYMDGDRGLEESGTFYCLWLLRAAIQNDPKALTYYGIASRWEDNSRSSAVLRTKCLGRADSLGFLPAKAKYAHRLWKGDGCDMDKKKAEMIFQDAINAGSILGSYGLMIINRHHNNRKNMMLYGEACLGAGYLRCYSELINSLLRYDTSNEEERQSDYAKAYEYCMTLKGHPDLYHLPKRTEWTMESLDEEKECQSLAPDLRYYLGLIYYWGLGVPRDRGEAVKQWERVEMGEDIRILQTLAYCYITGEGKEQDVKRGMGLLLECKDCFTDQRSIALAFLHSRTILTERDGAEALRISNVVRRHNCGRAAFLKGRLYEEGLGVEQSWAQAVETYEGFEKNDMCRVALARLRLVGHGCKKNVWWAVRVFKDCSTPGIPSGRQTLATFFWYKWWCDDMLGNLEAQVSLGMCMIKGEGIKRDVEAGLDLLKKASMRGSGEAHLCLYEAYSQGKWTAVALAKAKEHLEGAANLEEPTGMCLYAEELLDRDEELVRAIILLEKSLRYNCRQARRIYVRALMKRSQEGDKEMVLSLLRGWVELQDGDAMYELAYLVDNPKEALGLLHQALGVGMDKALPKLAEAYEKGLGTEVNQEQARLYRVRWSHLSH
ncbi:hypothetical protein BJ684DRAFT_17470 [Piptocephalis cylindrospora]|uniref:Protein kinase domain-containing protein n=1 Tax=Piptocephalis cylindrospora TaxID=1907219 RepID=A0A4P9Y2D3_9FUNG|nr:hypothetical protein BJ684DRAFT_17470 [Piptocephalis cylindrospora]|eukprot:RKP12000.1 hypothetical protein BJ684DRAFT_17470 [Piptocephalis cylindrospora]